MDICTALIFQGSVEIKRIEISRGCERYIGFSLMIQVTDESAQGLGRRY